MNEMKRPLDSGFFQFVDQRGSVGGDSWRKESVCVVIHGGPGGGHIEFKPFLTPVSAALLLIATSPKRFLTVN